MSDTAQKVIWTAVGVALVVAVAAILWNPLMDLAEDIGINIRGVQTQTQTVDGFVD